MDYAEHGFLRAVAVAPPVEVGHPAANAEAISAAYEVASRGGASLVVTPELAVTGYTCEDLFTTDQLLDDARRALTSAFVG